MKLNELPEKDRLFQIEWYDIYEAVYLIETGRELEWDEIAVAFADHNPNHPSTPSIKKLFGIG